MTTLRTVLHAHSDWSYDGRWPLDRIARTYGRLGADAVLMSEHDSGFDPASFPDYRAACAAASTSRCTLIPGIEYSSPDNDIHILTWGLTGFLAEHHPVMETLRAVRDAGGVAILAHPVRRDAWKQVRPDWLPLLSGIELWNRKSDGITWGTQALTLIRETGLPATVGQDFHRPRQIYPLTQRFDLSEKPADATALEADLVAELRAGRSRPMAFGQLLDPSRVSPGPALHPLAERLRAGLRDRIRSRRR